MGWILVATDGSPHATAATRLVASIAWPPDTTFGVVAVVPSLRELAGLPWALVVPANMADVEASELQRAQKVTWAAVDALRAAGLTAHCKVLRGHPAKVIVRLAERYNAEMVVLSSRGLGTVEAVLLGSVSAEVIDRAPCPVLVARSDRLGRSIIADDGSPEAEVARAFAQARPYLLGGETRLVGVAPIQTMWPDSLAPMDAATATTLFEGHDEQRHGLAERLEADAAEMSGAGIPASTTVRDGSPVAGFGLEVYSEEGPYEPAATSVT